MRRLLNLSFLSLVSILAVAGCNDRLPFAASVPGALKACGEINAPGEYTLAGNLASVNPNATCLNIHDVSHVSLDCGGKSISIDSVSEPLTKLVVIRRVNGFSLKHCVITTVNVAESRKPIGLLIDSSSNGVIAENVFSGYAFVKADWSSNLEVSGNTFTRSLYEQAYSDHNRIENNHFDWQSQSIDPGLIMTTWGSWNVVKNNDLDGYGAGEPVGEHVGLDDGIILIEENHDSVIGNNLQNFWDCGIENTNRLQNTVISGNRIKHALYAGIGGWWWSSWRGNVVEGNVVDSSGPLLMIYRLLPLLPGEDHAYFTDNAFIDNVATNPIFFGYSAYLEGGHNSYGELTDNQFVASNNTFTGNDFGPDLGPWLSPRSSIIDGGGNKCGPPSQGQATSPLVCS